MSQVNQWCRIVMNAETLQLVRNIRPEQRDVLEISGSAWDGLLPFKSYQSLTYPQIDICAGPIRGKKFDLIIAEQVFEHLRYPFRAGRNLFTMLNRGGYLLLTTPFLIKVHREPVDCTRWTEDGIKYLLEECGFDLDRMVTGSWGNRECIVGNFDRWLEYDRISHSLQDEKDFPMVTWALAQKPKRRWPGLISALVSAMFGRRLAGMPERGEQRVVPESKPMPAATSRADLRAKIFAPAESETDCRPALFAARPS